MNELLVKLGLTLDKLEAFIQNKAPVVYGIVKRQVLADGFTYAFIAGLLVISAFLLICLKKRLVRTKKYNWDKYGWVPCLQGLAWVAAFFFFVMAFRVFYNPDFYAITKLMMLIG